jgi:hypothetical protein
MTDTSTKTTISNVLGLKGKPKAPGPMPQLHTEQEQRKQAIIYALEATDKLEEQRDLALNRVHQLSEELAIVKTETARELMTLKSDTTKELMTQKQEYDSKLANTRADNDALRRQLTELGLKLEHYHGMTFTLVTQCENIEKHFANALTGIYDAGQHVAISMVSAINNHTVGLNDAARHAADGLTKQIQHQVDDARAFLADLKTKASHGEYRPVASSYKSKLEDSKLPEEAEKELAEWISRRRTMETEDEQAGDEH